MTSAFAFAHGDNEHVKGTVTSITDTRDHRRDHRQADAHDSNQRQDDDHARRRAPDRQAT